MKSVVEEGATLTKALEKAWSKAGKPSKFFVKILEHPVHAFWGLRSEKSAKVAIFFKETNEQNRPVLGDDILKQKEYAFLFEDSEASIASLEQKKAQSFKTRPLNTSGGQKRKPVLQKNVETQQQKSEHTNQNQSSQSNEGTHRFKGNYRGYQKPSHKQEHDAQQGIDNPESAQGTQPINNQPSKAQEPGQQQPRRRFHGRRPYRGNNRRPRNDENKNSEQSSEPISKPQEPNNT